MRHLLLILACSLSIVACGDDSSDDGDHDHEHDETDSGQPSNGDDDGGAFGAVACDRSGSGACENAGDCPIVESGSARGAAQSCGLSCLGDPEEETCAEECVVAETDLSADCAGCYVAIVACSRDNCLGECAGAPDSSACFDCQVENDCRSEFDSCSGLPPVETP
jgi:hypothetical protein